MYNKYMMEISNPEVRQLLYPIKRYKNVKHFTTTAGN